MLNYNQSNDQVICDTWGIKKDAGYWNVDLKFDFQKNSVLEHNRWYTTVVKGTIESFSSLTRVYNVYFGSVPKFRKKFKGINIESQSYSSSDEYLEVVLKSIAEYPVDIEYINLKLDFFVYVRTKESFPNVTKIWIRKFDQSTNLGDLTIYLNLEDQDPYACFNMEHTLFYPFSYQNYDDNTELYNLNRPLLEEALRNWEQKFNSEIEAEGLPGIYKYGYLPQDQW